MVMGKMLTAKEVQQLLQVDRSTVYRMAESGRLPAIKVGKQWRFPAHQLQAWLGTQVDVTDGDAQSRSAQDVLVAESAEDSELAKILPVECVQLIQDSHADLLGVMLVITDMEGNPVTRPSNPCGLFSVISEKPQAIQRCINSWQDLGQLLSIEPVYHKSHLGMLCARGLIRVGKELSGMVVAGCIMPPEWPPSASEIDEMAAEFGVEAELLTSQLDQVFVLSEEERAAVLASVQRVANIVAHIIQERQVLLGRLGSIAKLARL